jgi:hypothetical protein
MSNGCGCEKGVLKYVKSPYARKFYIPCCMHDDDYDRGGNKADRKDADRLLFFRMMRKVTDDRNEHPTVFVWMTIIAYIYYMAVRVFGRFYFNYKKE